MRFQVELTAQADFDVKDTYAYIRTHGPGDPDEWKAGLHKKFEALEEFADWKSLAPEDEYCDDEICQRSYGPFRILYVIRGDYVYVLTIRHAARRFLTGKQINRLVDEIEEHDDITDENEKQNND